MEFLDSSSVRGTLDLFMIKLQTSGIDKSVFIIDTASSNQKNLSCAWVFVIIDGCEVSGLSFSIVIVSLTFGINIKHYLGTDYII